MSSTPARISLRLPEGVGLLLRDLIHDRTGIFFEDSRVDLLLEKLEPLAHERGSRSFLEYYYCLKDDSPTDWDNAWIALSVQETYFWREFAQIRALTEVIVPDWFKKSQKPLKIWSAACASGEEPYSVVMALAEAGFGSYPIEVVGSDANPAALKKASVGVFRERSFRSLPRELREKYFESVPEGGKISSSIMNKVTFKRANLLETGPVAALSRAQVIYCRNVFIYFSPHAIRQTVAVMASRMGRDASLFVGASESLLRMTTDFELKEIGDALVYKRI